VLRVYFIAAEEGKWRLYADAHYDHGREFREFNQNERVYVKAADE
jgi:hypothetical protein